MKQDITNSELLLKLRLSVDALSLTTDVVEKLLPNGKPHLGETQLWDYKEKLPIKPANNSDEENNIYKAAIGDLIKDVVSFHNSYGGYIVFGVSDKGNNRIVGISSNFDCGEFNKRLNSYIGDNPMECNYVTAEVVDEKGEIKTIGLLLCPRRPSGAPPVRFTKEGPQKPKNERSFKKETYIRMRDECRPASNISSDWAFLHSDRDPPGQRLIEYRRNKVPSSLPARDPDLLEFLGRSEPLALLREWIADPRSPVRLITGIGGLGKTTLAYHFAEEVTEVGAGAVEQVIWLAAKVKTYSALKGEMVPVGRVDFDDLRSLLKEILKVLPYEWPEDEEEPDNNELEEKIIDALNIVPSLIVVDDIDSLDPDEQILVVSSLNSIGLRTVGRELASSKILMTSRIDQGLPKTSVIKIAGLERDVFENYIINVAKTFDIPTIYGSIVDDLYDSSSGSPLFAASIIRFVRLGENINSVIDIWKGQDGEEVRSFAFSREIERIGFVPARLLLAVILLGETSTSDLASVLDMSPKVVREQLPKLYSYHLLSTSVGKGGDPIMKVPSDLISVKPILTNYLGAQATSVEQACAKAEERSQASSKTIGLAIRKILDLWKNDNFKEAAIASRKLHQQYPKNADIACLFGASLLRISPPQAKDADQALVIAMNLQCNRPELSSYIIKSKTLLEDWTELYRLSLSLSSNEAHRDIWFDAFDIATNNLIKTAKIRGDHSRVIDLCFKAVEKATRKLQSQKLTPAFASKLHAISSDYARQYYDGVVTQSQRPGDQLNAFEAAVKLSELNVYLHGIIKRSVIALEVWWSDVEKRSVRDEAARYILSRQIIRLEKLERELRSQANPNHDLLSFMSGISHDLSFRGSKY